MANADAYAADLADILVDIREQGHETLRAMTEELNRRGILTRRGWRWHLSSVRNLLRRIDNVRGEGN